MLGLQNHQNITSSSASRWNLFDNFITSQEDFVG